MMPGCLELDERKGLAMQTLFPMNLFCSYDLNLVSVLQYRSILYDGILVDDNDPIMN